MKEYTFTLKYKSDPAPVGVTVYANEKLEAMKLALDYCDEVGYHPFDAISMICDNQVVFV